MADPFARTIDLHGFQLYPDILGDDDEDTALLKEMAEEALGLLPKVNGLPAVERLYLGFGIGGIVAVFLAHLKGPLHDRPDTEIWAVVGDLPPAFIGVVNTTPAMVLRAYCDLMQDWADRVLAGEDMSHDNTVHAEPTAEHARMLKSRIEFLREEIIPEAEERQTLHS